MPEVRDEAVSGVASGSFSEFTASTLVGVAALYEPWCAVEIDAGAVVD